MHTYWGDKQFYQSHSLTLFGHQSSNQPDHVFSVYLKLSQNNVIGYLCKFYCGIVLHFVSIPPPNETIRNNKKIIWLIVRIFKKVKHKVVVCFLREKKKMNKYFVCFKLKITER